MLKMTADQVATLRTVHGEAAGADDPVAYVAANLHRVFTHDQQAHIADSLPPGYGRTFEDFAETVAADFMLDDHYLLLHAIRSLMEDGGSYVEIDGDE